MRKQQFEVLSAASHLFKECRVHDQSISLRFSLYCLFTATSPTTGIASACQARLRACGTGKGAALTAIN